LKNDFRAKIGKIWLLGQNEPHSPPKHILDALSKNPHFLGCTCT